MYTQEETEFGLAIQATFTGAAVPELSDAEIVRPYSRKVRVTYGSTDVGDVSWHVPTTGLVTATWVPGTSAHSWQAVAAGGTGIGHKGMLLAAKVIARTAIDLMQSPETIEQARLEFENRRGDSFSYQPLLGDREPPLDYRAETKF